MAMPSHTIESALLAEGAHHDESGLLSITHVLRVVGVPRLPHNENVVIVFTVTGTPHSLFSYAFQLVRPDFMGTELMPAKHQQSIGMHGVAAIIQTLPPLAITEAGLWQIGIFLNGHPERAGVARVHFVLDPPVPISTTPQ